MTPADDYVHPVGPELNFNESMYFHFHDPVRRLGGFLRLANRPNERRGERTVCLYLPSGSIGFGFTRPEFAEVKHFRAAGMSIECIEPYQRLRVAFKGTVNVVGDPSAMFDPKAALSSCPVVDCTVLFNLTALAPVYAETFDGDGQSFAPNHYEQLMSVAGSVRLGDQTYPIDGQGLRDHSWGARSWQAPWFYRWLHGSSPTLGFMGTFFGDEDGGHRTGGFVWDSEGVHQCDDVIVATVRDAEHQPQTVSVELTGPDQRWTFTGEAQTSVPLRHRTADGATATRIAEACMTWSNADGTRLHGMAEYLDQMADGVPVGLHV
ncbi:MAG: hypothetical protein CK428_25125 [Mycobacterium sp.]|nr:MAG: hypothetical protein CK428_25125 [Mycobacterium sp.]